VAFASTRRITSCQQLQERQQQVQLQERQQQVQLQEQQERQVQRQQQEREQQQEQQREPLFCHKQLKLQPTMLPIEVIFSCQVSFEGKVNNFRKLSH
jgi:hypothetical protein